MSHHSARALAGLLAAGILLAGCSSDPDPVGRDQPEREAQHVGGGRGERVRLARFDADAGGAGGLRRSHEGGTRVPADDHRPVQRRPHQLNDLNEVAAGDLLDRDSRTSSRASPTGGDRACEGGQADLSAEPLRSTSGTIPKPSLCEHASTPRPSQAWIQMEASTRNPGTTRNTQLPGPRTFQSPDGRSHERRMPMNSRIGIADQRVSRLRTGRVRLPWPTASASQNDL